MMKRLNLQLLLVGLCLISPTLPAEQTARADGAMMANTCAACHGTFGRLGSAAFMPLAGMDETEFMRAMRAFRDGSRPATLMHSVAVGFDEQDFRAMAQFFAAQTWEE